MGSPQPPSRSKEPRQTGSSRPATIVDIAEELGISVASVSYALNNKPGVSAATRKLVLNTAKKMGWRANHAARALQSRRADAIGLVLRREQPEHPTLSDFMLHFIDGLGDSLMGRPEALVLHTVSSMEKELETYRMWAATTRVDAIVVVNIHTEDDPRLGVISEVDLPAVVVGDVRGFSDLPCIWTDDEQAMAISLQHFRDQGHSVVARLSDGLDLLHARHRSAYFTDLAQQLGLRVAFDGEAATTQEGALAQITELLALPDPPTAFQYDTTMWAARGLSAMRSLGLDVPGDYAVLTWDNSEVCEITEPSLSAIDRDAFAYGALVGRTVLQLAESGIGSDAQGTTSTLIQRQST